MLSRLVFPSQSTWYLVGTPGRRLPQSTLVCDCSPLLLPEGYDFDLLRKKLLQSPMLATYCAMDASQAGLLLIVLPKGTANTYKGHLAPVKFVFPISFCLASSSGPFPKSYREGSSPSSGQGQNRSYTHDCVRQITPLSICGNAIDASITNRAARCVPREFNRVASVPSCWPSENKNRG